MLEQLLNTLPQRGTVRWIGLRPERRATMDVVESVCASTANGLAGDRYSARPGGKRQVTLIQWEHLAVIAGVLGRDQVSPAELRRNLAISGLNLLALKGKQFTVGSATLEYTGPCAPCSFMEATFGAGGYNAVRGHGGICARVIADGTIRSGDSAAMVGAISERSKVLPNKQA